MELMAFTFFLLGIFMVFWYKSGEKKPEKPQAEKPSEKGTPGAVRVAAVVEVKSGDAFEADLAASDWPEWLTRNIPVYVKGGNISALAETEDGLGKFIFDEKRNVLRDKLTRAEKIELMNIERAEKFALLADLFLDGKQMEPIKIPLPEKKEPVPVKTSDVIHLPFDAPKTQPGGKGFQAGPGFKDGRPVS